ncbi:tigger transposable element-derived protein 1 [Trichonephila clavipes]|nr:tigger transposable element-derived protein 1 [Trichonephila clavipes]
MSSREQLIEEQRKDPKLGHIYRYLENPEDSSVNATICENWSRDFRMIKGLLFYAKYATSLGEMRVDIPKSLRNEIMREYHDKPLAGHFGRFKTYHKNGELSTPDPPLKNSCVRHWSDERRELEGKGTSLLRRIRVSATRVLPVIVDNLSGPHSALGQNQIEEPRSVERKKKRSWQSGSGGLERNLEKEAGEMKQWCQIPVVINYGQEEVQKWSPDHPVRRGHNREDQFDPEATGKNRPYGEQQKRSSSSNTRSRSGQQQHCQERKGGANSNRSLSLEDLIVVLREFPYLFDFIWPNGEKKHQRQSISLETKIAILYRLGKGEGSTAIGKHFNLGESTVRAIKKNEAAIRKSVISGTKLSTKFASYTRDVLLERTERAIAIWIEEQVQRRIPVSGYLIQEKALQFYKSMKQSEPSTSTSQAGKEFSASKGWLTGFLKRNALHNIKITGESATADEGAEKIFPEELAKFIEDGYYSADQVFNADETGHYWKKLPNRTYIAKDEKTASGHKASKDRVTLLLCSNASGDRMLKPLLINKSLRPRALKDLTIDGVVGSEGDNDEEEKSTPLTGKLIQECLQLCSKLENHFLINAPNSERASKLQCELQNCMS